MSVAVVPILPACVGSRGPSRWLCSCVITAKHGGLLQEIAAAIATGEITSPVALVAATRGLRVVAVRGHSRWMGAAGRQPSRTAGCLPVVLALWLCL